MQSAGTTQRRPSSPSRPPRAAKPHALLAGTAGLLTLSLTPLALGSDPLDRALSQAQAGHEAGVIDTVIDLDHLLAQDSTPAPGAQPDPFDLYTDDEKIIPPAAPRKDLPALDKLLPPDIRPAAPASSPAPAAAPAPVNNLPSTRKPAPTVDPFSDEAAPVKKNDALAPAPEPGINAEAQGHTEQKLEEKKLPEKKKAPEVVKTAPAPVAAPAPAPEPKSAPPATVATTPTREAESAAVISAPTPEPEPATIVTTLVRESKFAPAAAAAPASIPTVVSAPPLPPAAVAPASTREPEPAPVATAESAPVLPIEEAATPEIASGPSAIGNPPSDIAADPIIRDLPPALDNLPQLPPLTPPALPADLFDGQTAANPATPPPAASISTSVTVNLISKLVERGVLTQGDAAELIKLAQVEAQMAQEQFAQTQAQAQAQASAPSAEAPPGAVRVTYIPGVVKKQLKDEIRAEMLADSKQGGWSGAQLPDWINKVHPFGDVRLRYEYLRLPSGNDNTGAFPNFNAINTGAPFDVSGVVFSPQYNTDQDRQRMRLRARFGAEVDLDSGFTLGFRLATGDSNSPVSPNQTLGGNGGNFSKYQIWLDRGFIKYELGGQPGRNLSLSFGRFDNPFFSTDIIWDDDLGFDGIAGHAEYEILKGFTPFVTGGLFPIFNTDLNFATNQPSKFPSDDKWLYGAQIGFDWKIADDVNLKLAAAYYQFDNIEGRLSDPFIPLSASDAGNTDSTRPAFAQKGNTYRPIRNIVASPLNDFGTSMQYQYFGLATPFRELAYTARLEINSWEPYQIALLGEFVQNLDFNQEDIDAVAVNNRGPNDFATGAIGEFTGGDTAWFAGVQFGKAKFEKAGDWSATIGYRYVESDAVVDAFTDSDFGGGGTNLQGYVIGANVALSPNVRLGLRYMSADEIAGSPFRSDTIQLDLSAKF